MEPLPPLDDMMIQEKVEMLAGKGVRVVECEKSAASQTEERLMVNGFPIALEGDEGVEIKKALMAGLVPPSDLLSNILLRAGIMKNPVELESVLNVKCTTKITELITLRDKNGKLVNERLKEIEEDDETRSKNVERWKSQDSSSSTNSTSKTSSP